MTPRRLLGCVAVAALVALAWTGCKDKDGAGGTGTGAGSADLPTRCEQLAAACGDSDKRVEKIVAECKQAAVDQAASACTKEAVTAYDCLQKELCGKADKVWALDDLRVLSDRHGKCQAERKALDACMGT